MDFKRVHKPFSSVIVTANRLLTGLAPAGSGQSVHCKIPETSSQGYSLYLYVSKCANLRPKVKRENASCHSQSRSILGRPRRIGTRIRGLDMKQRRKIVKLTVVLLGDPRLIHQTSTFQIHLGLPRRQFGGHRIDASAAHEVFAIKEI